MTDQDYLANVLSARRVERDRLLKLCDWTQMPDAPLTTNQKSDWAKYRQALRDVPQNYQGLEVTWPSPPKG